MLGVAGAAVHSDADRFLALVCRELGALEARIVQGGEPGETGGEDARELRSPLATKGLVVVTFAEPPEDRQATQRRLEMLASTFDELGAPPPVRRSHPPVARSLRDELEALATRAAAVNAMVIDANSPIVWGAARAEDVADEPALTSGASSPRMTDEVREASGSGPETVSRRALRAVRGLPDIAALRKGRHVRCVQGGGQAPLVAHSFAGIYLLVVVFDAPFDELRAERAVLDALPRVERLVLALPPHDPDPTEGAGAVAMRRSRRH
jgi:hypothetical protein